ncbi:MAG: DNA polymerase III subunit delta [Gemmatimonadaceae bacterium]
MSAKSLREFRAAIINRTFDRAYYLHGRDEYRKESALRDLIAAAVDPNTRDFNFDQLRGADTTPEQLASALDTMPMMAERRVVVVRDVAALKRDARAVLDQYLRRPASDTLLILVAVATEKSEKIDKGIDDVTSVDFVSLGDKDSLDWIGRHAREEHNATITREAATLLHSAVGNDSAFLAAELDKLASYASGRTIDERAVEDVVGVRQGTTTGSFLDAVAERDAAKALALIEHVLTLPKSGAVPLIMALTVQTMAIGWGRHARDRGLPAQRLESEFFSLLKETSAFPMRPWGEAAKCWARNVSKWDAASIEQGLVTLLAADRAAKDTRISSDDQLLSSIVCALCTPARRAVA